MSRKDNTAEKKPQKQQNHPIALKQCSTEGHLGENNIDLLSHIYNPETSHGHPYGSAEGPIPTTSTMIFDLLKGGIFCNRKGPRHFWDLVHQESEI